LTLLPVCANAQRVSPSPAASPSAAPSPLGTANPAALKAPKIAGLLGDFGDGARSSLAEHGLTLNGHLVTEAAANLSGGVPLGGTAYGRGTAVSSEFGFGFDLDFDKLYRDSGAGTFHFLLTTRFGSNLSSEAIGNLASVEEIYGDGQTTRVTFLDYEQPLAKGRFDLRLGKYNQQNDFIAGSTYWGGNLYCFYQNNNICGTPAGIPINNGVVANGSEGYTYYPSSQWGARLRTNVSSALYVQAAAIQGNPIVNNKNGGLYFGFNGGTGVELPLEIGLALKDRAGAAPKPRGDAAIRGLRRSEHGARSGARTELWPAGDVVVHPATGAAIRDRSGRRQTESARRRAQPAAKLARDRARRVSYALVNSKGFPFGRCARSVRGPSSGIVRTSNPG
jgi:carbohydrate-selective porin OprB